MSTMGAILQGARGKAVDVTLVEDNKLVLVIDLDATAQVRPSKSGKLRTSFSSGDYITVDVALIDSGYNVSVNVIHMPQKGETKS